MAETLHSVVKKKLTANLQQLAGLKNKNQFSFDFHAYFAGFNLKDISKLTTSCAFPAALKGLHTDHHSCWIKLPHVCVGHEMKVKDSSFTP